MQRSTRHYCPALAALICLLALTSALAQGEKQPPVAEDPSIVTSELAKFGLVAKMRPILPEITTGDPLRLAMHFEKKTGSIDHSDPEVRIRAVSAAGNMDGGAPADLMGKVLDDTAPAVRRAAIRAVEESGDRGPMRLLIKRVADEELSERERALILHCIAVLGGAAAVKCLERHVRPSRFAWVPGRNTAWRDGVIKSLYDVDNSAVQTFLMNGISSLDHRYAEACEFALDHHRARGS